MSIQTASVTTTGGNVYVSTGSTAITWLSLCNWGAVPVTCNVFVVPANSSPDTSNIILTEIELLAANANGTGDTYQIYSAGEKLLLDINDSVYANCSANTVTAVTSYTSI